MKGRKEGRGEKTLLLSIPFPCFLFLTPLDSGGAGRWGKREGKGKKEGEGGREK